jgi:hypothetical protein
VLEAAEVESVADDVLCDPEAANFWIRACKSVAALCLPPLAATDVVPLSPTDVVPLTEVVPLALSLPDVPH